MKATVFALILAGAASSPGLAMAQQPAAPSAAAAPGIKHTCVKAEWPGRISTQTASKRFDAEHKAYSDCIRAFVAEQNKLNQESAARANAHVAAGNAAIEEFNQYVKDLNKASGKEDEKK